jgi:hypothetical protein
MTLVNFLDSFGVIGTAPNRLLEYRRVGGDAAEAIFGDQPGELAAREQAASKGFAALPRP